MKLTDLRKVDKNRRFWRGTRIRCYNVGMNVDSPLDDYYDYMLVYVPWDKDGMYVVNITANNNMAGAVHTGMVAIDSQFGEITVTAHAIIDTMGKEGVYIIEED